MKALIMLGIFATTSAFSGPGWLCEEVASQRKGNSIYACGIGSGADETTARTQAFDNARAEFNQVCEASDDCRGRQVSVSPERTSCKKENANIKCYRLVVFQIGDPTQKKQLGEIVDQPMVVSGTLK